MTDVGAMIDLMTLDDDSYMLIYVLRLDHSTSIASERIDWELNGYMDKRKQIVSIGIVQVNSPFLSFDALSLLSFDINWLIKWFECLLVILMNNDYGRWTAARLQYGRVSRCSISGCRFH